LAVVTPSGALNASRGKRLCTKPDKVKPKTSDHHVIQSIAPDSFSPSPSKKGCSEAITN
jgi:hypothetical protein